ncbi:MAG: hypothetical protein ABI863_16560 [Ginsengibacter sp.]
MNNTRQNILKTLAYFDYFKYPLTYEDICTFLPQLCNQPAIKEMLAVLVNENIIFKIDDFYSLQNDPGRAKKRREGNQRAVKQLTIAKKVAAMLSHFPYVQTVAVSGSLSKHFADEKADIDFFIITSANRLWIARTCMHFLKKLSYIAGKQNWLCMNYFVDEMAMDIQEKNIFTAMEIATLLPMQGINHFENFIAANTWIHNYFPANVISTRNAPEIKKGLLRKCFEKIFNTRLGDIIDKWLMNITDKRWKDKTGRGRVNDHGARIGMMVNRHFSKPDPKNFQAKVVQQYENKVKHLLGSNQQVDLSY